MGNERISAWDRGRRKGGASSILRKEREVMTPALTNLNFSSRPYGREEGEQHHRITLREKKRRKGRPVSSTTAAEEEIGMRLSRREKREPFCERGGREERQGKALILVSGS